MLRQLLKALTLVSAILIAAPVGVGSHAHVRAQEKRPLAIIVNPRNPVTNLKFNELKAYLKLELQYWPDKGQKRIELYLRPSSSTEMEILLGQVYKMTKSELRKYWVGKVFRGEIPAKPGVVPTAKSARATVVKVPNALTVVMFDEVPEDVRVLTIDGKKPDDEGYPLFVLDDEDSSTP